MFKIQHDRLIKLGQIMRSVKPENVNMGLILETDIEKPNECGTVGCALGHCSRNQSFNEWGVKNAVVVDYRFGSTEVGVKYKGRYYAPHDYALAGAAIFGISEDEAEYLFGSVSEYDDNYGEPEKEVFLNRFCDFMNSKNLHM